MAEEIQIPGTQSTAKIRQPWAVAVLSIVTIFIYYFFWYYKINREMADYGKARGTDELGESPGTSLLAVTLGALILVPALISIYHTGQRIQRAQRLAGIEQGMSGWLSLVMYLLISPVMFAYWQSELNKGWRTMDSPAPGEAAGPIEPATA